MNASSDAAEQVVRLTLEGTEFAIKIAGKGAKELAVFLYAAMRGSTRTKGKTRLAGMLRNGKELKVFSLKESDLKKFAQEAKKYGVLYAALKGIKKSDDGMVDIMVKAEDASKINRIFDRFSIAAIDTAEIKNEILRAAEERAAQLREAPDRSAVVAAEQEQANPTAEKPHSDNRTLFFTPKDKQSDIVNPTSARAANPNRSENGSVSSRKYERGDTAFEDTRSKPSVRKQLEDIRAERRDSSDTGRTSRQTSLQHKHNHTTKKFKQKKGR